MGSPIVVTFATIQDAANQIKTINGDIRSRLDELKRQVDAVASTWEGQAHSDYMVRQQKWTQAQTEMCQLLDQISAALVQTAEVYQQTETSNARMWGA
ncbi:WXG100 family type VII secretion target [Yinghuangia soli]|uniref:ESAT-6-like protein n=1 Tax=Yinghuangia soli TaxID=2908204 RepID=A0AA41Q9B9_9ACTN|nr:WXG100 family type VII secretion target [Yinghuangia soli]MCF2533662.1 WXG100 family type VII secretion target [Yinghuangia soli]